MGNRATPLAEYDDGGNPKLLGKDLKPASLEVGTRLVATGGGEQEILEAQEWLKARTEIGTIQLESGGAYTITDTMMIDTQRVGLRANAAKIRCTGFSSPKPILHLGNAAGINEQFPGPRTIELPEITGSAELTRTGNETGVYVHSATPSRSVRPLIHGGKITGAAVGLKIGSQAYMTKVYGTEIFRCGVGLQQEAGASDFSENVCMYGGSIYACDTLVQTLAGQQIRLFGVSLDYPYLRWLDIQAGGVVELYGCFLEIDYGASPGETASPIKLTNAYSTFIMRGGRFANFAGSNPYWTHLIETSDNSQLIDIDGVQPVNLGRVGNSTSDDALIRGKNVNGTDSIARWRVRWNTYGIVKNDMPSVPAIQGNMRNQVDDPWQELTYRVVKSAGAGTMASAVPPDGTTPNINARNGVGNYVKITGDGTWLISFPNRDPERRLAWQFFLNGGAVTGGTITIRERVSTGQANWNGTTLAASADTRNAYAANTVTFTPRTNTWERVSWKDCYSDAQLNARWGDVRVIEITTSGLTGALYLDDIQATLT